MCITHTPNIIKKPKNPPRDIPTMKSTFKHNFSKIYTKNERYLLIGCTDCKKTITFFHRRKNDVSC